MTKTKAKTWALKTALAALLCVIALTFAACGDKDKGKGNTEPAKYTLTVVADGPGQVTGGGAFAAGDTVAVSATVNEAISDFGGWYEGAAQKSEAAAYSFQMPAGNLTLTAKFGEILRYGVERTMYGRVTIKGTMAVHTLTKEVTVSGTTRDGYQAFTYEWAGTYTETGDGREAELEFTGGTIEAFGVKIMDMPPDYLGDGALTAEIHDDYVYCPSLNGEPFVLTRDGGAAIDGNTLVGVRGYDFDDETGEYVAAWVKKGETLEKTDLDFYAVYADGRAINIYGSSYDGEVLSVNSIDTSSVGVKWTEVTFVLDGETEAQACVVQVSVWDDATSRFGWINLPGSAEVGMTPTEWINGGNFQWIPAPGSFEFVSITPDMISGFDSSQEGFITVTFTYGGVSERLTVGVYDAANPGVAEFWGVGDGGEEYYSYAIAEVGTELTKISGDLEFYLYNGSVISPAFDAPDLIWNDGYNKDKPGIQAVSGTYRGYSFALAVFLTTDETGDPAGWLPGGIDSDHTWFLDGVNLFFIVADGNGSYTLPEYFVEYATYTGDPVELPLPVSPIIFGVNDAEEVYRQMGKILDYGAQYDGIYSFQIPLTADTYSFGVTAYAIVLTQEALDAVLLLID
ncbi:hypothetical protein FACS1894211_15360 [Clostridia bacterium]|nr:hypothetical protein FACS1894211_15360 [Clostridia bacterium]